MAIIIKEIEVKTIVEKRVIQDVDISKSVYAKIVRQVVSTLKKTQPKQQDLKKRER